MKGSARVLTAGTVVLALFACVSPPPPPPPPKVAQVCTNGALNNVPFLSLSQPFDPSKNQTPAADNAIPINQDVQLDLKAAFSAAPGLQPALCGLNGIFIDPTGCAAPSSGNSYDPSTCNLKDEEIADRSWGLRIYNNTGSGPNPGPKYIGLSLGLWNNKNPSHPWSCQSPHKAVCAPSFDTYETSLIRALLRRTANKDPNPPPFQPQPDPNPPSYAVSPATSAVSVVATLAHEYGHVLWWDTFVAPPGWRSVSNTATFCGGMFYPSGSWQGTTVDVPTSRWISFGDLRLQPSGAFVSQLPHLLRSGDYGDAGEVVNDIYKSGRWASALAAFSPDEDFVETFELFVLVNSGLQSYGVIITGHGSHTNDILSNVNSASVLRTKLLCFGSLPQARRPL